MLRTVGGLQYLAGEDPDPLDGGAEGHLELHDKVLRAGLGRARLIF